MAVSADMGILTQAVAAVLVDTLERAVTDIKELLLLVKAVLLVKEEAVVPGEQAGLYKLPVAEAESVYTAKELTGLELGLI